MIGHKLATKQTPKGGVHVSKVCIDIFTNRKGKVGLLGGYGYETI